MNKKLNKKASVPVLFWGVFLVIGAFIFFLVLVNKGLVNTEVKGQWQLSFLNDNYLEAEKILLKNEVIAKNVGVEIAKGLAENGGYKKGFKSDCGRVEENNLWNKGEQWCFPEIKKTVSDLAEKALSAKTGRNFSPVSFSGDFLMGKSGEDKVVSKVGVYKFENSFAVNLGYSFEEYEQLQKEAKSLVANCKDKNELKSCLDQNKISYWKYGSCSDTEKYIEMDRKVVFCVNSPNLKVLPAGKAGEFQAVNYKLALDFSSSSVSVSSLEVNLVSGVYEVSLGKSGSEYSYVLHYTNWPGVEGKTGNVGEIFSSMPSASEFGYFHKQVSFSSPSGENCPAVKEAGVTYLCGNKVVHVLKDETLVSGGDYFFTVTLLKEGKESGFLVFKKAGTLTT